MLVFSIINAPSKTIKKNTVNNNKSHGYFLWENKQKIKKFK